MVILGSLWAQMPHPCPVAPSYLEPSLQGVPGSYIPPSPHPTFTLPLVPEALQFPA